ncbi:MAG: hypothetical protein AAF192_18005 [Pseudomonadota bacterium]
MSLAAFGIGAVFALMIAAFLNMFYWHARLIFTALPYVRPDESWASRLLTSRIGRGWVGAAAFWADPAHEKLRRRWLTSWGIVLAIWLPGFILMFNVFPFEGIGE